MKAKSDLGFTPTPEQESFSCANGANSCLVWGFTLIELLVTLTVSLLLMGVLVVYSRTSERQIILWRDQAKIIGVILKSKSLALQLRKETEFTPCGYGVHFSDPPSNEFILFNNFENIDESCDKQYFKGKSKKIESYSLDSRLKFSHIDASDILFEPPEPTVTIKPDNLEGEATIIISTIDGGSSAGIKINNAGQITAQNIQ